MSTRVFNESDTWVCIPYYPSYNGTIRLQYEIQRPDQKVIAIAEFNMYDFEYTYSSGDFKIEHGLKTYWGNYLSPNWFKVSLTNPNQQWAFDYVSFYDTNGNLVYTYEYNTLTWKQGATPEYEYTTGWDRDEGAMPSSSTFTYNFSPAPNGIILAEAVFPGPTDESEPIEESAYFLYGVRATYTGTRCNIVYNGSNQITMQRKVSTWIGYGIYWEYGEVSIVAVDKTQSTYTNMPSTVTSHGTFKVVDAEACYAGCTQMTTVPTLSQYLVYGKDLFRNCTHITTGPSSWPSTLEDFEYGFYGCVNLTTVSSLPDATLKYCFGSCTSLVTSPVIPSGITSIEGMFYRCSALQNVSTIPASVTNMTRTFESCTSLEYAPTIPSSVKTMAGTFQGCTALKGDLVVYNVPTSTGDIFNRTSNNIYIRNPDLLVDVENYWTSVAALYDNVHYELEDFNVENGTFTTARYVLPDRQTIPYKTSELTGAYLKSQLVLEKNTLYMPDDLTFELVSIVEQIGSNTVSLTWDDDETSTTIEYESFEPVYRNDSNLISLTIMARAKDGNTVKKTVSHTYYFASTDGNKKTILADFINGQYLYYITSSSNHTVSASVIDESSSSYDAVPATITHDDTTYTVNELHKYTKTTDGVGRYLYGGFEDCENLTSLVTINASITDWSKLYKDCISLTAVTIPLGITNVSNTFENCIGLTGNIVVNGTPSNYTDVFTGTVNNLYIVTSNLSVAPPTGWRTIAADYTNVHYYTDDNSPPVVNIISNIDRGKYENGEWTPSEQEPWIRFEVSITFFNNYMPVGMTPNTVNNKYVWLDSETQPLTVIWVNNIAYIDLGLDYESQHTITFQVTDTVGHSSERVSSIVSGMFAMMDLVPGGKGLAIGTIATHNGLDISIPTTIGIGLEPPKFASLTNDEEVIDLKSYYIRQGTTEEPIYQLVVNPTGNPKEQGWYERGDVQLDNYKLSVGHYNELDDNALFAIGNGTSDSNRNDIFKINKAGNLVIADEFKIINKVNKNNYLELTTHSFDSKPALDIYIDKDDDAINVASFGEALRIGQQNSTRTVINSDSMQWYANETSLAGGVTFGETSKTHVVHESGEFVGNSWGWWTMPSRFERTENHVINLSITGELTKNDPDPSNLGTYSIDVTFENAELERHPRYRSTSIHDVPAGTTQIELNRSLDIADVIEVYVGTTSVGFTYSDYVVTLDEPLETEVDYIIIRYELPDEYSYYYTTEVIETTLSSGYVQPFYVTFTKTAVYCGFRQYIPGGLYSQNNMYEYNYNATMTDGFDILGEKVFFGEPKSDDVIYAQSTNVFNQLRVGHYTTQDALNERAIIVGRDVRNATDSAFSVSYDGNVYMYLEPHAQSWEVDNELYNSLINLGWTDAIIE